VEDEHGSSCHLGHAPRLHPDDSSTDQGTYQSG
jgi:hypothetical protein